ncbi:MAG: hypothetical protein R3178_09425 [Rhodothermales bacterium]|nr:hypothetical protein [Rhodothermales bacterium]
MVEVDAGGETGGIDGILLALPEAELLGKFSATVGATLGVS